MSDLVTLASPMADAVLRWSAEAVLVASGLAILAAIACRLRGRRLALGPAARHALWLVVLIKLMAPPVVHWPWSVPIPPDVVRPEARHVAPASEEIEAVVAVDVGPMPREAAPDRDLRARLAALTKAARELGPWIAAAWLAGSIALGIGQVRRIVRFRRRLRAAEAAPSWLVEEAGRVGRCLGVRVPAIRVLPGPGTPMLWCLGRPVLLVPGDLLASLDRGRWPAILAHELAHLRRLDPWVRRLELLAELVWWWNPLYWLTRRRLDFEAELACDAWVLWALPDDRIAYAESLIQIGSARSPGAAPSPSLGVAGAARSFERRLTMILSERVACRVPAPGLLGAALLTALALPSWTLAEPARRDGDQDVNTTPKAEVALSGLRDLAFPVDLNDDDDAPDDARATKQKDEAKAKYKAAVDKAKAALDRAKLAMDRAEKEATDARGKAKDGARKGAEKGPGPELEKKMEALGKDMEAKFGPGSDFEKKMKAMGKEMEQKFGPGSDFEKEMKALGKEMEEKFGPGSKFAEEMKALEKKAAKERSDADGKGKEMKKAQEKRATEARAKAAERTMEVRARADRNAVRARAEATTRRTRRIETLQIQIKRMTEELNRLKAEDEGDEDEKG